MLKTEPDMQKSTFQCGTDEAGRGCLAGPVVAAALIMPVAGLELLCAQGLTDSKKCSAKKRASLVRTIKQEALCWSVGLAWPREIERINILQASLLAMCRAVRSLRQTPRRVLIDGNQLLPAQSLALCGLNPQLEQRCFIGGDACIPLISGASIIAKTFRDHLMTVFDRRYPQYAFARHKGYGTREHLAALKTFGPCPLHRMTFQGVLQTPEVLPNALVQEQGTLC